MPRVWDSPRLGDYGLGANPFTSAEIIFTHISSFVSKNVGAIIKGFRRIRVTVGVSGFRRRCSRSRVPVLQPAQRNARRHQPTMSSVKVWFTGL